MEAHSAQSATYERLATFYRKQLLAKLPPAAILPSDFAFDSKNVTRVPETCGLLTGHQIAITRLSVVQLLEQMKEGKVTAVQVMQAFGTRAAIAHQLVSILPCPLTVPLHVSSISPQSNR